MSILSLHGVSLHLASVPILLQVDWQIESHERIALVGRNGAGKSTLLKLLQGQMVQDSGQIQRVNGLKVLGLTQDVPVANDETVYHFLVKGLGDVGETLAEFHKATGNKDAEALVHIHQRMEQYHAWTFIPEIEIMATRLGIDPNAFMRDLSGGMKRRVLLAAVLIASPDLLLLDEPTNHLDINAIEWLESYLKTYKGSVVVVTHDRTFLSNVASSIIEIDRGHLYRYDANYETYLDRREGIRLAEQKHQALFDKRLSEEEAWIRTGVKARRTRNEGRVRALKALREEHKNRRLQMGKVKTIALDGSRSGQLVIEASHLSYQIENKILVRDLSILITRGDKVGIIGPNGCGKTTLVRLLLQELVPDQGVVRHGTSLQVAYFDQLRSQLDEKQTVMANVADGADYVTLNGQKKHVASYLSDFLFDREKFNQPVSILSGGERNRLLLAKLLAKPVNLLVMDEPTNDLDIETLELLETMLVEYQGTLLLISHDRAFINQVVTSVLVYEGEGQFNEYVGGYDDVLRLKKSQNPPSVKEPAVRQKSVSVKLSFNEQRELSKLPEQIEVLERTIEAMQLDMTSASFYQKDPSKISEFKQELQNHENKLKALYERWELLESKK